jgi:hypothetical protein
MSLPMMKCGHTAQGTRESDGHPVCIICLMSGGPEDPATIIEDNLPDLSNRRMQCSYTRGQNGLPCPTRTEPIPSRVDAAFFSHRPDRPLDEFYCGCWGWD